MNVCPFEGMLITLLLIRNCTKVLYYILYLSYSLIWLLFIYLLGRCCQAIVGGYKNHPLLHGCTYCKKGLLHWLTYRVIAKKHRGLDLLIKKLKTWKHSCLDRSLTIFVAGSDFIKIKNMVSLKFIWSFLSLINILLNRVHWLKRSHVINMSTR